ncbi:MAG: hypothetical protein ACRYHB_12580, partial [Janthinobacterium lividum]
SGENRAREAAQAAMASPLLEAGAIDGARGILINITGSSTLKLSEVNEASMLIQDAAHEDANIIFGAVLDERLGDEVKITVIATGFKHQRENEDRRERMLEQSGLARPGILVEPVFVPPIVRASYPAPVVFTPPVPVAVQPPESVPASPEVTVPVLQAPDAEDVAPRVRPDSNVEDWAYTSRREASPSSNPSTAERGQAAPRVPQPAVAPLVPVPASAFDDDFFRRDRRASAVVLADEPVLRTDVRVPTFAGLAPAGPEEDHGDLDIPAFLRRGNA